MTFQGEESKGRMRCKGLKWAGKDQAPQQCKSPAQAGTCYCGVHLKAMPFGDIDHPKDHPGCPMYMPQEPSEEGKAFWAAFKAKVDPKVQQVHSRPADLLSLNPVELLLQKILETSRQGQPSQLLSC